MKTAALLGSVDLPATEISVSRARAYVRDLVTAAGWRAVDEVVLLVSELVSNAVQHSESGRKEDGLITVTVTHSGRGLQVDVTDEGSPDRVPHVQPMSFDSDGGRGLWLVDQIAAAWGVEEGHGKRVVWFQMAESVDGFPS